MVKQSRKEQMHTYTVFFEPIKGGYNIFFPAIPEICTFGKNLKEAREMAKDALRCFLESAAKEKASLPRDVVPLRERIAVSV
ncbi:MAG: type II toxin-antitoxin system HicB family antitoxin [bacterium]|nr:type II toxin-antitoxin system HicB family antitoxin [bacterium]